MNTSNKFSMNQWREFITEDLQKGKKYVIKVKDLTFDMVKDIFTDKYQNIHYTREQPNGEEGPAYKDYVNFTKGEGSAQGIIDAKALEQWKSYILGIKGIDPNVEVTLDPNEVWYDKAVISDPIFVDREKTISQAAQDFYDKSKIDRKTGGRYTGD